jgi:hypothetical protein
MSRKQQIGFSQRIQLEWLEFTANLVLAGHSKDKIQQELQTMLSDKLSIGGKSKRGNREKAITILMKIWLTVPKSLEPLCDDGLQLIKTLSSEYHLAIHWGMSMAVYPFFGVVAETVGRLIRLQGNVATSEVFKRIKEIYGQRDTIIRPTQRVIRCFADWGVLLDTPTKGVYIPKLSQTLDSPRLIAWLIEAQLRAKGTNSDTLNSLTRSPSLFPFNIINISASSIDNHDRISIYRHSLDEELVSLQKE